MEVFGTPGLWYGLLQIGVASAFVITAVRAWNHSRARFVELMSAFLFGLLLEQGDIFLFGTYRYNENWLLLGDVPIAIAMTWALIIAGATNLTDALGIRDASNVAFEESDSKRKFVWADTLRWVVRGLPAPMADAVWAISIDLAIDAVAIRLGLWTWTIGANEGWFGVPWGNFFAWLFVAFWFSLFTRLVRAGAFPSWGQWAVPVLAFVGLIATLLPFVALENTSALPFVPDNTAVYRNEVWILFGITLVLFIAVTWWALLKRGGAREYQDHWLLLVRLGIHGLFLLALLATGMYLSTPLLLLVAVLMLAVEFGFIWHSRAELRHALRQLLKLRRRSGLARSPGGVE